MKIYKCEHCGTMIEILEGTETNIKCCGEKMNEVSLKRAGIGQQKHLPVCDIDGDSVFVGVGEEKHPMDDGHFIKWIMAVYSDSVIKYTLSPGDEPEAIFDYEAGMEIYTYCNLHGLWSKKI